MLLILYSMPLENNLICMITRYKIKQLSSVFDKVFCQNFKNNGCFTSLKYPLAKQKNKKQKTV